MHPGGERTLRAHAEQHSLWRPPPSAAGLEALTSKQLNDALEEDGGQLHQPQHHQVLRSIMTTISQVALERCPAMLPHRG